MCVIDLYLCDIFVWEYTYVAILDCMVYVCVRVGIYVCECVCVDIFVCVCMRKCSCCMNVSTCVRAHASVQVCVCIYNSCTSVFARVRVCERDCLHLYT